MERITGGKTDNGKVILDLNLAPRVKTNRCLKTRTTSCINASDFVIIFKNLSIEKYTMFIKFILINTLLAQITFGASIDKPNNGLRGNDTKRKLKSSKNDELEGDFGKALEKGYKKFDGEVTLVFPKKKDKAIFDIEYEIEDGPENCGEDDDCRFVILDKTSCDDVEDEDRFYDTKKDPYDKDDFEFYSNEYGNAVGVLRDLDVGYEIDDLKGKVIILVGPKQEKSRRRQLKGKTKEVVIACAVLES
jgi:hypothetical protein